MIPRTELHLGSLATEGAPAPPNLAASLEQAFATLWRRRLRIVLVFLVVTALGLAYLGSVQERFTAQATLMVGFRAPELTTTDASREPPRGEPDFDGAIELIKSDAAIRAVAATLSAAGQAEYMPHAMKAASRLDWLRHRIAGLIGSDVQHPSTAARAPAGVEILRTSLKVERIGRSNLISVAFTAQDPAVAALAANAFAGFSANDDTFLNRMTLVERSGFQIVKTSLVSPASAPLVPSAPNVPLIGGAVALLAFGAALSAALFAEWRAQQTVLSTMEINRRGLRALGVVPSYRASRARSPVFHNSVDSLQAALTTLPKRIPTGGQVLLFTSALPREGKSATTAALGISMAGAGKRVLIVDADLRSPTQDRTFDLPRSPGLSAFWKPGLRPMDIVQVDLKTGVSVVTAGGPCHHPLQVLGSQQLREMIAIWRKFYDVVLIDSPPVLPVGDVRLIAPIVDHVVVVARWGKTSWVTIGQAMRIIAESGGRIAGISVSRANIRTLARYDYGDATAYAESRSWPMPAVKALR